LGMPELTREFVEAAFKAQTVWDFGNEVLYKLCADNPCHTEDDVIIAKTNIVGRVYAAQLERRRDKGDVSVDAFYMMVAKMLKASKIDVWLDELKAEPAERQLAIQVHKRLTDLTLRITGMENRSFASKYLHFHLPDRFFIYDTRAKESANKLIKLDRRRNGPAKTVDKEYTEFFLRCEQIREIIRGLLRRNVSPREVDKVLLHWNQENL
jgi:hypothetical protein